MVQLKNSFKFRDKLMKNNLLKNSSIAATLLASFICVTSAFAQTSVWKVSKGNDHIYLAGTVQILPVSELPYQPRFPWSL